MNKSLLIFLFALTINLYAQTPIAVIDFEGFGISQSETMALTNRLRNELHNTGSFKVIERNMMEEILNEQGFQQTGCTSNECLVEIGRLVGVRKILGGSISIVGDVFSVSVRIVDVETGEVLEAIDYDFKGEIGNLLTYGMRNVAQILSGEKIQPKSVKIIGKEEKNPKTAFYYSLFLPGLGQSYAECSKTRVLRFSGGAAFSWLMTIFGYSMYKSEKDNADKLYSLDPTGIDPDYTIYDDLDEIDKTGADWRNAANTSIGMVRFFGLFSCALNIWAAIDASNQAKKYNQEQGFFISYNPRYNEVKLNFNLPLN